MRQRGLTPILRWLHPKRASVRQSQGNTAYPSLQAAGWGMESEQHAGRGLSAPRYLVRGKTPSRPEAWAWAPPQKDQTLRITDGSQVLITAVVRYCENTHTLTGSVVPGGAGDGQGEAVFGATLCGVDWADEAPLVGWGGPPNRSPRRSVVVAAEVGGWDEGRGQLMPPPSRPRRSTSSGGSGFAEGGSGLGGAVSAVLRWCDRESISSSEGSLSTRWPSWPPCGRLGSADTEREEKKREKASEQQMAGKRSRICKLKKNEPHELLQSRKSTDYSCSLPPMLHFRIALSKIKYILLHI